MSQKLYPFIKMDLFVCFWLSGPLGQYFSFYRAVIEMEVYRKTLRKNADK